MSGSGGYYKYRCKYWLTYNCPNWVWVNNAPCAHCLADGRDSEEAVRSRPLRASREVYVPQLENGLLQYIIMEIVALSDVDSGWSVKELSTDTIPIATGPNAVSYGATTGSEELVRLQKSMKKQVVGAGNWSRAGLGMDWDK